MSVVTSYNQNKAQKKIKIKDPGMPTLAKKYVVRPTLMRDRKRKIADRESAVFDLAKSFSFREQKPSCVRSKNRLGFSCEVSGMPTVSIIRNLNLNILHAGSRKAT